MFKTVLISLAIVLISIQGVFAYTVEQVSQHTTSSDCWVIFEDSVYDLTDYLYQHDRYLDIRQWCGSDMTQAFITKDNTGRDHKGSSYGLLETYKIGEIDEQSGSVVPIKEEDNNSEVINDLEEDKTGKSTPYNLVIPLFLSILLYWIPYLFIKKNTPLKIKNFNAFWNSMLILLLLIPAFGFGVYMILRYRFPTLWNTSFDFMYWHVELSLVMGILGINHFLQRVKVYFSQIKNNRN